MIMPGGMGGGADLLISYRRVRNHRSGCVAGLERDRVVDRLNRAARLTRAGGDIDVAVIFTVEIIF